MNRVVALGLLTLASCARASTAGPDAGAGPRGRLENGRYVSVAALDALDCIEAWEQLCAPHVVPELVVMDGKVVGEPWIDKTEVEYAITRRTEERLELEVRPRAPDAPSGAGEKDAALAPALLEVKKAGRLRYSGPELAALAEGRIEPTEFVLVPVEEVNRRKEALEKEYVPGGECDGLYDYDFEEVKTKCLNTPDGKVPKRSR